MEIKNLSESNVKELEGKLSELMKTNPDIEYTIFTDMKPMLELDSKDSLSSNKDILRRLAEIETKIIGFENVIKLIFGNHVLMNGKFIQLK